MSRFAKGHLRCVRRNTRQGQGPLCGDRHSRKGSHLPPKNPNTRGREVHAGSGPSLANTPGSFRVPWEGFFGHREGGEVWVQQLSGGSRMPCLDALYQADPPPLSRGHAATHGVRHNLTHSNTPDQWGCFTQSPRRLHNTPFPSGSHWLTAGASSKAQLPLYLKGDGPEVRFNCTRSQVTQTFSGTTSLHPYSCPSSSLSCLPGEHTLQ